MNILGRHRVRATFYHIVAIIFLISTLLWYVGLLSDKASYMVTAVLFVVDYLAEMYDPHPDNPGPWYSHFHRMMGETEPVCEFEQHYSCHIDAALSKHESEFAHKYDDKNLTNLPGEHPGANLR